jgi:hypothetical protein
LFALDTLLRVAAAVAADRPEIASLALAVVDASTEWSSEPGADRTRERFLADLDVRLGSAYPGTIQRGRTLLRELGSLGAITAVLDLVDAS